MKNIIYIMLVLSFAMMMLPAQKTNTSVQSKITFVELGSVNCIPCKKMQPVMKAIKQKYGGKVKVLFYDVRTDKQKQYAKKYGIRLIPTQVFLDENGKEFFRHEGFYPEEEIHKLFKQRGVVPTLIGG